MAFFYMIMNKLYCVVGNMPIHLSAYFQQVVVVLI